VGLRKKSKKYFVNYSLLLDFHLFSAAWRAICFRRRGDIAAARACPPNRPSVTAAAFLPSDSGAG
jgi:hypothetical protein